jgi:methylmalonyl-CoA mutase C-terminal domain/subunit
MKNDARTRIIMAKFGLDGHSNGIKIVSRWLQDAGFEVIYLGLYNTPEGVIKAAGEEDVSIVGGSFLEGAHLFFTRKLVALAARDKLQHLKFVVGGVIPPDDVDELKRMGVSEVFTPGTPRDSIVSCFKALARENAAGPP